MRIKKNHFLNDLLEKQNIPSAYKCLRYEFNNILFYEQNKTIPIGIETPKVQVNIAFPKFLKPDFNYQNYNYKKIPQRNQDCFGIIINPETKNINQYLSSHFSKNSRSPIIKKMKRLESCFNIKYKVFYGDITKKQYDYLIKTAHVMLVRRFEQRNDRNFILKNWQKYNNILFSLINEKKASIFVIYNNDEPIQISINFHNGKTFFAYIPAYNIDYAQFSLGNTAVYKQLEWCIENDYEYLDMGNGVLEYKTRWCNYHYLLETHIYYKSKSLNAKLIAIKEINIIKAKNLIKDMLNSLFYSYLKKNIPSKKTYKPSFGFLNYTTEKLLDIKILDSFNLDEIDVKNNTDFKKINKSIYDFLYKTKEHFDHIKAYKIKNENNSFIIQGKTSAIKVCFNQ